MLISKKVALITGAARRIGAEIAIKLHGAGMCVVVHYHTSQQAAQQLCQRLNQQRPDSAWAVQADLSQTAHLALLVQQAVEKWGRLDVLVNNASRFYPTRFGKITEEQWQDLFDSNLKSVFFLSQAAAPLLTMNQGCIVNLTDIHGDRPLRDYSVYCLTKAGVLMLTKVLAKELGPLVRVNGVSPGAIIWPEGQSELSEEVKQQILDKVPLATTGALTDIAKAVLFLVRDAGYVTGQIIAVDGGRLLSG